MRFGFFIPQGWRLDLVGIDVHKHWAVMRDLAAYADGSRWDSVWVYDHFHTVPMPTERSHPRGVVADVGVCGDDVAGQASSARCARL